MSINEKLRSYIEENGLKHGYVAKKAGMDHKKFSRIMNGHKKLTVEELEIICKEGLSITPSIFFD